MVASEKESVAFSARWGGLLPEVGPQVVTEPGAVGPSTVGTVE